MEITKVRVTDLKIFKQCRAKYNYSHVLRLAPKESLQDALFIGKGIHAALETLYSEKKSGKVITPLTMSWKNHMQNIGVTVVEPDVYNLSVAMLESYQAFHQDADKDWKIIDLETDLYYTIQTPLGPVEIGGRRDMFILENDTPWIVDHKAYKRFPDSKQLELDEQITLYCWLSWKLGTPVAGVILNVILKDIPEDIPTIYNGKALSQNRNLFTTHKLYLAKLRELGFDESKYKDFLQMLKERDERTNPFVQRFYVNRTQQQLEVFEKELIEQLMDFQQRRIYMCPDLHCSWCDFQPLCSASRDAADVPYLIETLFRTKFDFER